MADPVPSTARECLALVTNALIEAVRLDHAVDLLPTRDGNSILLQWPHGGPAFKLTVRETDERVDVVEWRGKVPVIEWTSSSA